MDYKRCQIQGHNKRTIEALCLQPSCKDKRLLCVHCIQKQHKNHDFTIIQDSPSSKLKGFSMHGEGNTSESNTAIVQGIILSLLDKPKKIIDRVQKFKQEYYQKRLGKMKQIIMDCYKNGSPEYAKNRILSPQITDPQIQKIVQNIVMFGKPHLRTSQLLLDSLQFMMYHLQKFFEQGQKSVRRALDKMQFAFQEWDIFGDKDYIYLMNKQKESQEQLLLQKKKITIQNQKRLKKMSIERKWKPLIDWIDSGEKFDTLKKLQLNGGKQGFLGGLFGGSITVIQGFEPLTNLRYLDLGCNSIQEIQNLDHMTKLMDLRLYSNQIRKIQNLGNLKELRILYLGGNKIERIQNLEGLQSLQKLSLSNNKIIRIENLLCLPNLDQVWLYTNPAVKDLNKLKQEIIDGKPITIKLREKHVKVRLRDLDS